MPQRIYQIDAFTNHPFAGNPAGVCVLPAAAPEAWMQAVAREMNLSETAFLTRAEDGFNLRWFTPATEVELCGHATLASAHALWETGLLRRSEQARFHTLSGLLTASYSADWIEMDFPATPAEPAEAPPELLAGLGLGRVQYSGRNIYDYLLEVEGETTVRGLQPDFGRLGQVPMRGVIVTARATTPPYDFVSRWFGPQVGVNEDSVTGSAHCCLGPYWAARLDKDQMLAYQASPRGGVLRVRPAGERVLLGGQAVTVLVGEMIGEQPATQA
jgi:PhzF family phenazine biosynthesis protein